MRYADGQAKKPIPFELDSKGNAIKADKSTASETEIEELEDKIDEFYMKDSLVKQQLFSTISDQLLFYVNLSQKWGLRSMTKIFMPSFLDHSPNPTDHYSHQ
ncbi:hypothetical protein AZE42_13634 [Rhizopogon vesiculosus]|uniref:Uncharacterized protein n=1 Tax=Rhizopogon vesiculosus TaxID=180088 RepID=A0A1J8QAY3_9AGAM|nr:hypothetical protein AZE42_13634 [Rhizopogon vesiculosus]